MMYPNNQEEENVLEKYGRDITKNVTDNKVDPVIGRDEEIRNVIRILSRKTKNNPVLIGEPGVGKTAIVEGLEWLNNGRDSSEEQIIEIIHRFSKSMQHMQN